MRARSTQFQPYNLPHKEYLSVIRLDMIIWYLLILVININRLTMKYKYIYYSDILTKNIEIFYKW